MIKTFQDIFCILYLAREQLARSREMFHYSIGELLIDVGTLSGHCRDTVGTLVEHQNTQVHQNYSETARATSRVAREPSVVCKRYFRIFFMIRHYLEFHSRAVLCWEVVLKLKQKLQ